MKYPAVYYAKESDLKLRVAKAPTRKNKFGVLVNKKLVAWRVD